MMASSTQHYDTRYKQILENIISAIQRIDGSSRHEIYSELNRVIAGAVSQLEVLSRMNPVEMPLNLDKTSNWRDIIESIRLQALENERMGTIANNIVYGGYMKDLIANHVFISPQSLSGNEIYRKTGNVVIHYDASTKHDACERLNNVVFSLLLSLPPKKIRLSIVDFGMEGAAGMLTRGLDPDIFHDEVIVEQGAYSDLLKRLQTTMAQRLKKYGDIMEQNEKARKIHEPIELVLLIGDPDRFDYHLNELTPIWENGRKGGVLFICMKNTDIKPKREDEKPALTGLNFVEVSASRNHYTINPDHDVRLTPIAQIPELTKLCFDYINAGFRQRESSTKILEKQQVQSDYEDCSDGTMEVSIGETEQRVINFSMNLVDHIHAFVLGMSGSGKSVLLHNIITNLISKYSPEQLELYLMDFKLGGVEFNRYRNTKHVKALLVDNSDNSVVMEILNELSVEMYERGKALQSAGVQRIDEYNAKNPSAPLPQVLVVVDECHNLFCLDGGKLTPTQNKVSEVIRKITKEGRSQGVHLILATQTLSGVEISQDILNNISDHYLLKSAEHDSNKLVPECGKVTLSLPTGRVFYHHQSENLQFQGYYVGDKTLESKVKYASDKAAGRKANGEFYFSGSQKYTFGEDVTKLIFTKDRSLIVSPGETLSLRHKPVTIELHADVSQNILVTGIDDENSPSQSIRSTMAIIASVIAKNQMVFNPYEIVVINCLDDNIQLREWERIGAIKLLSADVAAGKYLAKLSHAVMCKKTSPTFVAVIGQHKFKQLKKKVTITVSDASTSMVATSDMGIENYFTLPDLPPKSQAQLDSASTEQIANNSADQPTYDFGFEEAVNDDFKKPESESSNLRASAEPEQNVEVNVAKALNTIIERGPEQHVHTLIQIDRPQKLLFDEKFNTYTRRNIDALFSHILIHKGDEASYTLLGLRDKGVLLSQLTNEEDRLKAYYLNVDADYVSAYSPYILPSN